MKTLTSAQLEQVSAGISLQEFLKQEVELANWSVFGSDSRDYRGEAIFNRFDYRQSPMISDPLAP